MKFRLQADLAVPGLATRFHPNNGEIAGKDGARHFGSVFL
jgi:hypothetical protein